MRNTLLVTALWMVFVLAFDFPQPTELGRTRPRPTLRISPFSNTSYITRFTRSNITTSTWAAIHFLASMKFNPEAFFTPLTGGQRQIILWGVRARIRQQYTNDSSMPDANVSPACAYLGVDDDVRLNPSEWYINTDKPFQILLRSRGEWAPENPFEWFMNVTLFVNVELEECMGITAYNISWNLEYLNAQFSYLTGYYLAQSKEVTEYGNDTFEHPILVNSPMFRETYAWMTQEDEMSEYTAPINYVHDDFTIHAESWLCGRGLGNGTWLWDCGPLKGKPFEYTNWAVGEPSLADGCLLMCQYCELDPKALGTWYSKPCSQINGTYVYRQLMQPQYGYVEVFMVEHPTWTLLENHTVQGVDGIVISAKLRCVAYCARQRVFPIQTYRQTISSALFDVVNVTSVQTSWIELEGLPNSLVEVNLTYAHALHVNVSVFHKQIIFEDSYSCRINGSFTLLLTKSSVQNVAREPSGEMPSRFVVSRALDSVSTTTSYVSFVTPSPAYQMIPSVMRSSCAVAVFVNDTGLSLSPMQHVLSPTTASFGGHINDASASAVLWNVLLVLGIVGTHGLLVFIPWFLEAKRCDAKKKMSTWKFPGLLMGLAIFLLQGTCFYISRFYSHSQEDVQGWGSHVIIIVGMCVFPLGVIALSVYIIKSRELGTEPFYVITPPLLSSIDITEQYTLRIYKLYVEPRGMWNASVTSSYYALCDPHVPQARWTV
eukprot:PhF_6_TR43128/c0_g1_i1/m.65971